MNQLSLFDEKIMKVANDLLDLLNDGRKESERYEPQYTCGHEGYTILIVANKHKDILLNVVDDLGNIPDGFSVNWRTIHHIKQELKF
ncbi:hypothetical protein [Albibacterium profundi]|uniref:Uncharacterized protein n=1 Tax=Albibacterium profundi TaxID=3134906 RepID=A0ABV5CEV1_9SPHI